MDCQSAWSSQRDAHASTPLTPPPRSAAAAAIALPLYDEESPPKGDAPDMSVESVACRPTDQTGPTGTGPTSVVAGRKRKGASASADKVGVEQELRMPRVSLRLCVGDVPVPLVDADGNDVINQCGCCTVAATGKPHIGPVFIQTGSYMKKYGLKWLSDAIVGRQVNHFYTKWDGSGTEAKLATALDRVRGDHTRRNSVVDHTTRTPLDLKSPISVNVDGHNIQMLPSKRPFCLVADVQSLTWLAESVYEDLTSQKPCGESPKQVTKTKSDAIFDSLKRAFRKEDKALMESHGVLLNASRRELVCKSAESTKVKIKISRRKLSTERLEEHVRRRACQALRRAVEITDGDGALGNGNGCAAPDSDSSEPESSGDNESDIGGGSDRS